MRKPPAGTELDHGTPDVLGSDLVSASRADAVVEDPSDTVMVAPESLNPTSGPRPAPVERGERRFRGDPNLGLVLGGQYRLERSVGHGGTGRVYVATQLSLGRSVAVKMLRPELDTESAGEQFAERFFREASLAGGLSHPNVVTIHDYGRDDDGTCFIVMELVEGRSLKALMKAGPLESERALDLFVQIARGLRHAHRSGLVHRDVKPGNVQITPGDDGKELAKLLDFGLVKSDLPEVTEITREGSFLGTPHYASPEQVRGQEADARSDLYAFGVMLYRAFTGVLPYYSRNSMALAMAHVRDPYPKMAERAPNIRVAPEHEAIVRKLLQKNPAKRYGSADALLVDLEQALDHVRRGGSLPFAVGDPSVTSSPVPAVGGSSEKFPLGPLIVGGLLLCVAASAGGFWWSARGGSVVRVMAEERTAEPPVDWSAEVLVAPEPVAVQVSLASEPSGAEVRVDGAAAGHTPWVGSLMVDDGVHQTLELRHPGYQSRAVVLTPNNGQAAEIVRLEAVSEGPAQGSSAALPPAPARPPTPDPEPTSAPAPAPAPPPNEASAPAPAQAPASESAPTRPRRPPSAEASVPATTVEGVTFSGPQASWTLQMANTGSKAAFLEAGIRTQEFNRVQAGRPFEGLAELAAAPGVGPKTLQRMRDSQP